MRIGQLERELERRPGERELMRERDEMRERAADAREGC